MGNRITPAFELEGIDIPIANILPLKTLPKNVRNSIRYLRIKATIAEVGIVEPPVVYRQKDKPNAFLMLDGHVRLDIAKTLGQSSLYCLVSLDDEAFTYNHKINQLQPIQEHFMVLRAIKNGVSEARIARVLNVDPATIRIKRDLLVGVCPEAVEILKERRVSIGALREIKRVKPMRQIEMAELMVAANNYNKGYAECLVAAMPDQIIETEARRNGKGRGLPTDDAGRMQREMQALERDFKMVQDEYGQNMLSLVVVVAYIRRLMDNAAVMRYLSRQEPAMLAEFQKIVEASDLRATA